VIILLTAKYRESRTCERSAEQNHKLITLESYSGVQQSIEECMVHVPWGCLNFLHMPNTTVMRLRQPHMQQEVSPYCCSPTLANWWASGWLQPALSDNFISS
jgi:hypothetical protein